LSTSTVEARWEHFEHGADIGVRGIAATEEGAFEQAAIAVSAIMTDPDAIVPAERVEISCDAPDDELLLVEWLNALIYEMDTRGMLFRRFEVGLEGTRLRASAWGEAIDLTRHAPGVEVKGATYTSLSVGHDSSGAWIAQCVVDV
jgi:tRNA nucleotidyltransferase (CCA-adding enzyme)